MNLFDISLTQVCGKDHILHDEDVIQIVKLTSAPVQAIGSIRRTKKLSWFNAWTISVWLHVCILSEAEKAKALHGKKTGAPEAPSGRQAVR